MKKISWLMKDTGYWSNITLDQPIDELRKSGYSVTIYWLLSNRIDYNTLLTKSINKLNTDYIVTEFNHYNLFVKTIKYFKKLGIKIILIASDTAIIPYYYKKISKHVSIVWLFSNHNETKFKRWGANYIIMPFGSNFYKSELIENRKLISKIMFYGNPYGSRIQLINKLVSLKIDVDIYSDYLYHETYKNREYNDPITNKNFIDEVKLLFNNIYSITQLLKNKYGLKIILGKFISIFNREFIDTTSNHINIFNSLKSEDFADMISRYKLVLTPGVIRNTGYLKRPVYVANLRHFETPSYGGIMLVDSCESIDRFFKTNEDFLNLNDKESYYQIIHHLSKSDESLKMQKYKVQLKTKFNHSWTVRFRTIENTLTR
jgi:hypothetical protein